MEEETVLSEEELLLSLRDELTTLRSRVVSLESQLAAQNSEPLLTSRTVESEASEDIETLSILLEEARIAKAEALQYSRVGKNQLARKVRQLYGLLQQANTERQALAEYNTELERKLEEALVAKDEVAKKAQLDRSVFAKMIKEDRERYSKKLREVAAVGRHGGSERAFTTEQTSDEEG